MQVREDLPLLLNKKGLTGVGVEVGSCRGEFAVEILKKWEGKKLYLIDAWTYFEGIEDINNGNPNQQLDNIANCFMATYFYKNRVCMIKEFSVEAAQLFADQSLDFVYIDAAHDYENVYADLMAWLPKVKKGGILAGHDYFDGILETTVGKGVFGVKQAVDSFFEKVNVTNEKFSPSWWVEL